MNQLTQVNRWISWLYSYSAVAAVVIIILAVAVDTLEDVSSGEDHNEKSLWLWPGCFILFRDSLVVKLIHPVVDCITKLVYHPCHLATPWNHWERAREGWFKSKYINHTSLCYLSNSACSFMKQYSVWSKMNMQHPSISCGWSFTAIPPLRWRERRCSSLALFYYLQPATDP